MSRALWLRFFGVSIFFALLLSGLYLVLIREVAGKPSDEVQHSVYLFLAHIAEERPYAESVQRIERYRAESPAMPLDIWVVDDAGKILAGSTNQVPPPRPLRLERPQHVHEMTMRGRFFSGGPALAIIRLDAPEPTYLVVHNPGTPARGTFLMLAVLFIGTLIGAIFLGLLLVTSYLRGRSQQVRGVIARIEAGDLAARFDADRLDAVGGLMLDFNRMADEIQRLVARLQTTERARRELLQELGHDLRTPLTSLRTAIDTLAAHGDAMPAGERAEFLGVATSELVYFGKLIDDLFFIAEIDEPRYRKQSEHIDLGGVIASEMHAAQGTQSGTRSGTQGGGRSLRFDFADNADAPERRTIIGDRYLISRLFRNAYDNAARYARSTVRTAIAQNGDWIDVMIEDDGIGMSAEAIECFGKRRSRRLLDGAGKTAASLGLGSVIIRTIVDLHGGRLKLESSQTDSAIAGTRMTMSFPLESAARTRISAE
jgi:signal transduction histidine kinase